MLPRWARPSARTGPPHSQQVITSMLPPGTWCSATMQPRLRGLVRFIASTPVSVEHRLPVLTRRPHPGPASGRRTAPPGAPHHPLVHVKQTPTQARQPALTIKPWSDITTHQYGLSSTAAAPRKDA